MRGNVRRYGSPNITFIKIEYDIHLTNNHPNDSVTSHTLEINEEEYDRLTELYERF